MRTWGPAMAVTGLFVMIIVAASLQGDPVFSPGEPGAMSPPPLPTEGPAAGTPAPLEIDEPGDDTLGRTIALIVAALVGAFVAVLLVRALVRLIRRLRAGRRPPRRRGTATGVTVPSESIAADDEGAVSEPVVRRGIDEALDRVAAEREPSDAIIAAWIGLERAAAEAGITRAVAETPAEFARRIIGRRGDAGDETDDLRALYEAVRFGARHADESDRTRARSALRRIREAWR